MTDKTARVGIFGGTFTPPHVGHINAAKEFVRYASLDELLVIPDYLPPHKELHGDATANQRLDMTRLAFLGIDKVTVSDIELRRGGKSYTVDTLRELSSPLRKLILYCGTDMLLSLDTWHQAEDIFKLADIAYASRTNDPSVKAMAREKADEYQSRFGAHVIELPCKIIDISSSEIRERIHLGKSVSEYVTPQVEKYISEWNLYK